VPLVALLVPRAVLAQTPPCDDVDGQIHRANAARREGRDQAAVDLLRPLLACGENPRLQATLGLAELSAALWVQGFQHISAAVGAEGDSWVRHHRATLRSALEQARPHLGYLEVTSNVPRAELRIGGERAATLPMSGPMRVTSGALTYELSADGYVTELRRVDVSGNDVLTREHVLLTPRRVEVVVAAPVAAAATPVANVAAVANVPVVGATSPPPVVPPTSGGWMRTGGWVGLASSAALLGAGVGFYMVSSSAVDRWNDDSQCFYGGLTRSERCGDARDTALTFYPLALTGLIAGGALAVGSVALFIAAPSRSGSRDQAWMPFCGMGPGTLGVACVANF